MQIFKNYYNNVIKYDLINKFYYTNHKQIPQIINIILNFNCKNLNVKNLVSSLVALELITMKKGIVLTSKKSNIVLKIRKGNPIGCKITLKKKYMNIFFFRLVSEIFPNIKLFKGFYVKNLVNYNSNSFIFKINKTLFIYELENYYQFFKDLPPIEINIITNSVYFFELTFLLQSYKFPIIYKNCVCNYNSIGRV
jgi:large subunit ribosomal protein L5